MHIMMPSARFVIFFLGLCICIQSTCGAWANEHNTQPTHQQQKVGGFLLSSGLKLEQHYTTNLRASADNERGDFVTTLTPEVSIQKNFRDHELTLLASLPIQKHLKTQKEDTVDGHISLTGLLIAKRSLTFPLSISYDHAHIARHRDTSTIEPIKPVQTRRKHIEGGFIFAPNRLRVQLIGHYTQNRFRNNASKNGSTIIYTDDDHNNAGLSTKIRYDTRSALSPFLAFKTHKANFLRRSHNGISFNGNKRDYRYSSALAGVEFEAGTFSGQMATGYNTLRYDDNALKNLNAFQISMDVAWRPIERSNIAFSLSRTAMENSILESAYTDSTANATLRYEAQNNLALYTGATVSHHNYTSGRDDFIYEGQIGMDYLLNTAIQAHANITTRKRNSDIQNEDYRQNIFMLGITGNL
ncbi:MAG: hypothetical protein COA45_10440 [Zetaproteobacteria bacterium]|nr:MAG: hypothetical protein COA45_10440 [Zetaproteobacteria bacterium]